MTQYEPFTGLNNLTLQALQGESIRAHVIHTRKNGKSMLNTELDIDLRLAAVCEELGEVCRAYIEYRDKGKIPLIMELIQLANVTGSWAQSLTDPGKSMLTDNTLDDIQDCSIDRHLNCISHELTEAHTMLTLLGQLYGALCLVDNSLLDTSHRRTWLLLIANAAATWAQSLLSKKSAE